MHTNDYREKQMHGTLLVPYAYYPSRMPQEMPIVPLHWHPEFELDYVRTGHAVYRLGDTEFLSEPGDIILLPPNILHGITPKQGVDEYHDAIVFHGTLLNVDGADRATRDLLQPLCDESMTVRPRIQPEHPHYSRIAGIAHDIFVCVKRNDSIGDIRIKSGLLTIIGLLWENGDIQENRLFPGKKDHMERLRTVLSFINEHYTRKIGVEELARIANFSPNYFISYFHSVVNMSVMEYVIHLRIRRACEMLRSGQDSITYIAMECGYHNISNFNRKFREIVGCTPSQYRCNYGRD